MSGPAAQQDAVPIRAADGAVVRLSAAAAAGCAALASRIGDLRSSESAALSAGCGADAPPFEVSASAAVLRTATVLLEKLAAMPVARHLAAGVARLTDPESGRCPMFSPVCGYFNVSSISGPLKGDILFYGRPPNRESPLDPDCTAEVAALLGELGEVGLRHVVRRLSGRGSRGHLVLSKIPRASLRSVLAADTLKTGDDEVATTLHVGSDGELALLASELRAPQPAVRRLVVNGDPQSVAADREEFMEGYAALKDAAAAAGVRDWLDAKAARADQGAPLLGRLGEVLPGVEEVCFVATPRFRGRVAALVLPVVRAVRPRRVRTTEDCLGDPPFDDFWAVADMVPKVDLTVLSTFDPGDAAVRAREFSEEAPPTESMMRWVWAANCLMVELARRRPASLRVYSRVMFPWTGDETPIAGRGVREARSKAHEIYHTSFSAKSESLIAARIARGDGVMVTVTTSSFFHEAGELAIPLREFFPGLAKGRPAGGGPADAPP